MLGLRCWKYGGAVLTRNRCRKLVEKLSKSIVEVYFFSDTARNKNEILRNISNLDELLSVKAMNRLEEWENERASKGSKSC